MFYTRGAVYGWNSERGAQHRPRSRAHRGLDLRRALGMQLQRGTAAATKPFKKMSSLSVEARELQWTCP